MGCNVGSNSQMSLLSGCATCNGRRVITKRTTRGQEYAMPCPTCNRVQDGEKKEKDTTKTVLDGGL